MVHGSRLPCRSRAVSQARPSGSQQILRAVGPQGIHQPHRSRLPPGGEKRIDIGEAPLIVGHHLVPAGHAGRDHMGNMLSGQRAQPVLVMRLGTRIVFPGHGDESGGKLGNNRRILHDDVAPGHHGLPIMLEQIVDTGQLPDEQLGGLSGGAFLVGGDFDLKRFVKSDVDEGAGEQSAPSG